MSAEELTVKISADVDEAITGFQKVQSGTENVGISMRKLATDVSGVMTSTFALYNAWDNVCDMQVSVDRANLQVSASLNSLQDVQTRYTQALANSEDSAKKVTVAQQAYDTALAQYGADSEQAKNAADKLTAAQENYQATLTKVSAVSDDVSLAQERYRVAVERADMVQGNLNETIVRSALTVIPTMITLWTSCQGVSDAMTASQWSLNGALSANPVGLVVVAIAGLIAILVIAYNTCEPFRNAVDALAATLVAFANNAVTAITGAVNTIVAAWTNFASTITAIWNTLWSGVMAIWNATVGPLIGAIQGFINTIQGAFQGFYNWLVGGSLWGSLCGGLIAIWNSTAGTLIGAFQNFAAGVSSVFQGLSNTLSGIWNGIVSVVGGAVSNITGLAADSIAAAQKARTAAEEAIAAASKTWSLSQGTTLTAPATALTTTSGITAKSVIEGGAPTVTTTTTKTTTTTTPVTTTPTLSPSQQWLQGMAMRSYQYGGFGIVKKPTVFVAGERGPEAFAFQPLVGAGPAERPPISIHQVGPIHLYAQDLGSPFDRDRTSEEFARQITHKLALRVITR